MTITDEKLVNSALKAVKPWNSIDAMTVKKITPEQQSKIDKCCNCQYAYCFDCMRAGTKTIPKFMQFIKLFESNQSAHEICEKLQISRASYFNYKKKFIRSQIL